MKKLILIALGLMAFAPANAGAEVFIWKDPDYKIRLAFPDNWMRQAQVDENMRLSILAPQGADHAACRLYASHDSRFMDAPAAAGIAVSSFVFDQEALRREVATRPDTDNVRVTSYSPNGGFGRSAASLAEVDFRKNWVGSSYNMHGIVFASQHRGDRIVMSCETLASAWDIWQPTLMAIVKSVDFPAGFATTPSGLYRHQFQYDGNVFLPLNRRYDGYAAY